MKIKQMVSDKGNAIANQFIIDGATFTIDNQKREGIAFQSYNSIIVFKTEDTIYLDENKWDYSKTTGKYRNLFLRESKKETQKKIDSGIYKLVDLN